jgi:hypothetical protein
MTMAVNCESCGMPLAGAHDHANTDPSSPYCNHCAPGGRLQSVDESLERFTQWTMRQDGLDYEAAKDKARAYLKTMPAWKNAL